MSRVRRIAPLVGVTTLVLAAPASASVTIGSNLSSTPDPLGTCVNPPSTACALANTDLPAGNRAAGGVASPIDGVVVSWSFRSGGGTFDARPRVIRGHGVVAVGEAVASTTANPHPTRLSIKGGDVVGLDVLNLPTLPSSAQVTATTGGTSFEQWDAPPSQGDMGSPDMMNSTTEVLVSAVVEADVDGDGYGDETQDACPDVPDRHLEPCHDPPPPTNTGGGSDPSSGGGTSSSGTGGSSGAGTGTTLGGALPNGPPVVTAPPPLPTPKTTKKKRCKRAKAKHGHHAKKRCPKKKRRPSRRR
jgi:hypothetical protein